MKSYLDIVRHILDHGERKENRTGVDALTVAGVMFEHDMAQGFPLLTTKKMPFKTIRVELEFFIKGLTDKQWLQERRCTIWNEWANPKKAPYGHDEASKKRFADLEAEIKKCEREYTDLDEVWKGIAYITIFHVDR